MTRAAVYKYYDANEGLLYVGCSQNPKARLESHRRLTSWAANIARMDEEWFDSREKALMAERLEIMKSNPAHNTMWNFRLLGRKPDSDGYIDLAQWMVDNGRSIPWVGRNVPISTPHLIKILNGSYTPRPVYRLRINEITDGAVPVDSWEGE